MAPLSANGPIDLTSDGDDDLNDLKSPEKTRGTAQQPISIDAGEGSDEEDEDLKLAIALSLQDQQNSEPAFAHADRVLTGEDSTPGPEVQEIKQIQTDVTLTVPFLGLNRKQMEAERLARLKRKREETDIGEKDSKSNSRHEAISSRPISPPILKRAGVRSHVLGKETRAEVSKQTSDGNSGSGSRSTTKPESGLTSKAIQNSTHIPILYPDGVVLQTRLPGYPETPRNISFAALISPKSNLQSALLSSFIWDFDWLFPHFDTKTTNFLLVMHAKYESERMQIQKDFEGIPNIRLCFPPMEGQVNCMHSKLMLLFYGNGTYSKEEHNQNAERCRIVVPTANLIGMDWGVGSIMENTLWVIDLPKLIDEPRANGAMGESEGNKVSETEFQRSLCAFLMAQTAPEDVLQKLNKYDFGKTKNIGFIHSIGGSHGGKEDRPDDKVVQTAWWSTGHCGLGRTIASLGLTTSDPIQIDFITSSLGSLNDEFMRSIYLACQGDDGLTEYTLRTSKVFPVQRVKSDALRSENLPSTVRKTTGEDWRKNFRFYFPSKDTVVASNGGPDHAGTICFSKKWWESPKFPRYNMKDCVSVRSGLLMHNKIIFTKYKYPVMFGEHQYLGWAYVGSGNLSESAWGRLVQDKVSKKPKLNCRNWECGVLIPVEKKPTQEGLVDSHLAVFANTIPIPITLPDADYQTSDRQPWCMFG